MSTDPWWPWRGLAWWFAHPACWLRSLAVAGLASGIALIAAGLVAWWLWPATGFTGWGWWGRLAMALGAALATGLVAFLATLPLLMALLLDALVAAVRRQCGLPVASPSLAAAMGGALGILRRSLPRRLGCGALVLGSGWLGPAGLPLAWYASAIVLASDAFDTALAAEDVDPTWRWQQVQCHRDDILAGALAAVPLLAVPLLGWLLLPPALVCGAALRRAAPP